MFLIFSVPELCAIELNARYGSGQSLIGFKLQVTEANNTAESENLTAMVTSFMNDGQQVKKIEFPVFQKAQLLKGNVDQEIVGIGVVSQNSTLLYKSSQSTTTPTSLQIPTQKNTLSSLVTRASTVFQSFNSSPHEILKDPIDFNSPNVTASIPDAIMKSTGEENSSDSVTPETSHRVSAAAFVIPAVAGFLSIDQSSSTNKLDLQSSLPSVSPNTKKNAEVTLVQPSNGKPAEYEERQLLVTTRQTNDKHSGTLDNHQTTLSFNPNEENQITLQYLEQGDKSTNSEQSAETFITPLPFKPEFSLFLPSLESPLKQVTLSRPTTNNQIAIQVATTEALKATTKVLSHLNTESYYKFESTTFLNATTDVTTDKSKQATSLSTEKNRSSIVTESTVSNYKEFDFEFFTTIGPYSIAFQSETGYEQFLSQNQTYSTTKYQNTELYEHINVSSSDKQMPEVEMDTKKTVNKNSTKTDHGLLDNITKSSHSSIKIINEINSSVPGTTQIYEKPVRTKLGSVSKKQPFGVKPEKKNVKLKKLKDHAEANTQASKNVTDHYHQQNENVNDNSTRKSLSVSLMKNTVCEDSHEVSNFFYSLSS